MIRPRAQISAYVDNHGQASDRAVGVQEPTAGQTAPVIQAAEADQPHQRSQPAHARRPNATPGNTQNGTPAIRPAFRRTCSCA